MDSDVQLGPMTTKKRLNEIEELVEKTKQEGAKVLLGGKRPSGFNKGFYYEPTIFDDVKDNFTIMKQEPFGPLVSNAYHLKHLMKLLKEQIITSWV